MVTVDATTFYGTIFALIILSRIIGTQGGLKIVLWRIRGIKWFMRTEVTPDQSGVRTALKMKIVKAHSTPSYTFHGKEWFCGGPDETARIHGAPNWVYRYDDARPLKLKHDGEPIDPTLIHSAFENKSIEAFNRLGKPDNKAGKYAFGLFGVVVIILLLAIIAYTYYYGVNVNCALKTNACPGG